MCQSFSWEGFSPLFLPQGPHFSFSQEDFLTSILPSLTETDTVLFIFTLDGEREDGNGGVRGWRQQSDSEELSLFQVLGCLLGGGGSSMYPDWAPGQEEELPESQPFHSDGLSLSLDSFTEVQTLVEQVKEKTSNIQHPGLGTQHCGAVPAGEGPDLRRGPRGTVTTRSSWRCCSCSSLSLQIPLKKPFPSIISITWPLLFFKYEGNFIQV